MFFVVQNMACQHQWLGFTGHLGVTRVSVCHTPTGSQRITNLQVPCCVCNMYMDRMTCHDSIYKYIQYNHVLQNCRSRSKKSFQAMLASYGLFPMTKAPTLCNPLEKRSSSQRTRLRSLAAACGRGPLEPDIQVRTCKKHQEKPKWQKRLLSSYYLFFTLHFSHLSTSDPRKKTDMMFARMFG